MIKKIAILGSTGSIGKNLLEILNKDKKKYKITLLTANKNFSTLLKQAKQFNVRNIIITNRESFKLLKQKTKGTKIKIFNNFDSLDKIFKKKNDYTMSAITGIEGLKPTLDVIRFTKKIAIANKESIICGWSLLDREIKKNKTTFIPVDSEHFSLWFGLKNLNVKNIENIILTASGGPLHKIDIKKFKNIKISEAIKHPNWKMGRKISVDSATMINKIYEVIEAKNIFNISYSKISILIHPKSYIHAILKFNNGLIKIIAHETTMKIPIFNTLFFNTGHKFETKKLDLKVLNNLDFKKVDPKRYQMIKLLDYLPSNHSLYETVIVSANDVLVELFLNKKIEFLNIQKTLFRIINLKEFLKYKNIFPKNIKDILDLNNYVRLKILKKVYKTNDDKKLS